MKKFLSVFVSVLMAAQAVFVPATAQEVEEAAQAYVDEQAVDTRFWFSDVECLPGDTIHVRVSMTSEVEINSVALSNLTYDGDLLEFLGFSNCGELITNSLFGETGVNSEMGVIVFGHQTSSKMEGDICDLVFRVKDEYGIAEVSMDGLVKNNSTEYVSDVWASTVSIGHVDYSLDAVGGAPGELVRMPLYIDSEVPVDSIALSELSYDSSILTFERFDNFGEIVTESLFGEAGIDQDLQIITIALNEPAPVSGKICDLVFTIKEDAPQSSSSPVQMIPLAKCGSLEINSFFTLGIVAVGYVSLTADYGLALPEDEFIDIPLYINEIYTDLDTITIGMHAYDAEQMTFLGFVDVGGELCENSITLSGIQGMSEGICVCFARFKINEGAEERLTHFRALVWLDGGYIEYPAREVDGVIAVGGFDAYFESVLGTPGEFVEIDIYVDCPEYVTEIVINDVTFSEVLTYEESFFYTDVISDMSYEINEDGSMSFVLVPAEGVILDGLVSSIQFKISEDASNGIAPVAGTWYMNVGDFYVTNSFECYVDIVSDVCGDVSGDHVVDFQDALLLFQHMMVPGLYPLNYPGSIDFNEDGVIDIGDSLRLYQHAMLPDLYPIKW